MSIYAVKQQQQDQQRQFFYQNTFDNCNYNYPNKGGRSKHWPKTDGRKKFWSWTNHNWVQWWNEDSDFVYQTLKSVMKDLPKKEIVKKKNELWKTIALRRSSIKDWHLYHILTRQEVLQT